MSKRQRPIKATKKNIRLYLKYALKKWDIWAIRCLYIVYSNQTEDEKTTSQNVEHNGVGFRGIDTEILTSFVQFYEKNGFLTPNQMEILKRKTPFYWKQVLNSCDEKALKKIEKYTIKYFTDLRIKENKKLENNQLLMDLF